MRIAHRRWWLWSRWGLPRISKKRVHNCKKHRYKQLRRYRELGLSRRARWFRHALDCLVFLLKTLDEFQYVSVDRERWACEPDRRSERVLLMLEWKSWDSPRIEESSWSDCSRNRLWRIFKTVQLRRIDNMIGLASWHRVSWSKRSISLCYWSPRLGKLSNPGLMWFFPNDRRPSRRQRQGRWLCWALRLEKVDFWIFPSFFCSLPRSDFHPLFPSPSWNRKS